MGVHLVTEGADNGNNNIVRTAEPFLVIIPTDISGTWTYDLHVYPKNFLTDVTKELDGPADATAYGAGGPVVWNVSAMLPTLVDGDTFTQLRYVDTLDPGLDFESITDVKIGGTGLEDSDYDVLPPNGQEITLELTAAGLGKAQDAGGSELTYTINTVVSADVDTNGDGVVTNDVTQHTTINGVDYDYTSDEATTNWGTVRVLKQDVDNQNVLEGAEVQVFASQEDAEERPTQSASTAKPPSPLVQMAPCTLVH